MSFLTVVKTLFDFLSKAACLKGLRSFFSIFSISFNSGPRYLVYFVEVFLLKFTLKNSMSLALIFYIPAAEVIV
jgi:hypothetical protein